MTNLNFKWCVTCGFKRPIIHLCCCFALTALSYPQIYLNMLFFTPLFMETGFPFSSSMPASPPSPAMPSSFWRSSSSNSACVFLFFFRSSSDTACGFPFVFNCSSTLGFRLSLFSFWICQSKVIEILVGGVLELLERATLNLRIGSMKILASDHW